MDDQQERQVAANIANLIARLQALEGDKRLLREENERLLETIRLLKAKSGPCFRWGVEELASERRN